MVRDSIFLISKIILTNLIIRSLETTWAALKPIVFIADSVLAFTYYKEKLIKLQVIQGAKVMYLVDWNSMQDYLPHLVPTVSSRLHISIS